MKKLIILIALICSQNLMGEENMSIFGKLLSSFKSAPKDNRKSVPVHVTVSTQISAQPQIESFFGNHDREQILAGVGLTPAVSQNQFSFEATYIDRSIGVHKIPDHISFSFRVPSESTSFYTFIIDRADLKNIQIDISKYSPSRYPEDTLKPLFRFDYNKKIFTKLKSNLPEAVSFMNDFVHPWKVEVKYESPAPNQAPEYFVTITEVPKEAYLSKEQIEFINSKSENLATLNPSIFKSDNIYHIDLIHWLVRLNDIPKVKLFLSQWEKQQSTIQSPYWSSQNSAATQGIAFVMSLRDSEMLKVFMNFYDKQIQSPKYQRGLEFGFLAREYKRLNQIDKKYATEFYAQTESYSNLVQVIAGYFLNISDDLFLLLDMLPTQQRTPEYNQSSIFGNLLKALHKEQGLLKLYSSTKKDDEVHSEKEKIKKLREIESKFIKLQMTPTPYDLIFISLDIFEYTGANRKLITDVQFNTWCEHIFDSQESCQKFYQNIAQNFTSHSEKVVASYNLIKNSQKSSQLQNLSLLKDRFLSEKNGFTFEVAGFQFIKKEGRLFIQSYNFN